MYKIVLVVGVLLHFSSCKAQIGKQDSIPDFLKTYSEISNNNYNYTGYLDSEKQIVSLETKDSHGETFRYKMLIKDIHPEGIFKIYDSSNLVRILSIDNGKKFIEEGFKNGYRVSHNTNIIDIKFNNESDDILIDRFIEEMKKFLTKKKDTLVKEIKVIIPPNKKGE